MSKPKISLAPPKSKIELQNYLTWLGEDFEIKILNKDDSIEGALVLCGGPDIGANLNRDEFELKLISQAIKERLPILGVCRGMQLLNYFLGGEVKDIDNLIVEDHRADDFKDDDDHHEKKSHYHWIKSTETGDIFMVNSRHHQYCSYVSDELKVIYVSLDGLTEAFIGKEDLYLGVQWHPERKEGLLKSYPEIMPIKWLKKSLKQK
jgi:gamma-glutamyl-gamma-aminobutyrate hydrolase PuuD